MGRIIAIYLLSISLSGCVAASAVSSTAVNSVVNYLQGKEESLTKSVRTSLVAIQRGLHSMDLAVQVLEPIDNGYLMEFNHATTWSGTIEIRRETNRLSTVRIRVIEGLVRQDAIERAVMKSIQQQSEKAHTLDRFDFKPYYNIRENPMIGAKIVGWYLPNSPLEVSTVHNEPEWLRIKMPSGKQAFLKGSIQAFKDQES